MPNEYNILTEAALMHSELSEALEANRNAEGGKKY